MNPQEANPPILPIRVLTDDTMTEPNTLTQDKQTAQKPTSLWTKVSVWGIIIVILAFLGWALLKRSETRPQVGEAAPGFTLQLFDDYYGEFNDGQVTLTDLNIFKLYFNQLEVNVPECDNTNYNFWETP